MKSLEAATIRLLYAQQAFREALEDTFPIGSDIEIMLQHAEHKVTGTVVRIYASGKMDVRILTNRYIRVDAMELYSNGWLRRLNTLRKEVSK